MKHLRYLQYVLKHKYYTFLECCKLGIPWLGIIHDWSKFLPGEFIASASYFYGEREIMYAVAERKSGDLFRLDRKQDYIVLDCVKQDHRWRLEVLPLATKEALDLAWLRHQKRNKHHWQAWVLLNDDGSKQALPMPDKYRLEMLADLRGAERSIVGGDSAHDYYLRVKDKILLHPDTRHWLEGEFTR